MTKYRCEDCGAILTWRELTRVVDEQHRERIVCPCCATEKYLQEEQELPHYDS